jgi:hypothetical protein
MEELNRQVAKAAKRGRREKRESFQRLMNEKVFG